MHAGVNTMISEVKNIVSIEYCEWPRVMYLWSQPAGLLLYLRVLHDSHFVSGYIWACVCLSSLN